MTTVAARNQSTKTVTLIPGDGIGPEIAASVQRSVSQAVTKLEFHFRGLGAIFESQGNLSDSIK